MRFSSALCNALSILYGAAVRLRNFLFDKGILCIGKVPITVVSVGNIEAGGTGKTPLTMALASMMEQRGVRTCIVTRGYRGRLTGPLLVRPSHRADEVGDEAVLMARTLDVPVVKSPDRTRGALFALVHLGSELVILDDGFQHRWLERDMDIVLVSRDIAHERLLPAGPLREPPSSLSRATHVFAAKGSGLPYPPCDLVPVSLVDIDGQTHPLSSLSGRKVLAVCGVGSPEGFFRLARTLCAAMDTMAYPDHHRYTRKDMDEIARRSEGMDAVLTTEKDLVKMDAGSIPRMKQRWYALRVQAQSPVLEEIADEIEHIVQTRRVPGQG